MSRSLVSLVLIIGSIAMVVLLMFRPQSEDFLKADIPPKSKDIAATGDAAPAAVEKRFDLVLKNGQLTKGNERLQVQQGDKVRIVVKSDVADELHLHGYDLTAQLKPNEEASLAFTAKHNGRFEAELHHSHKAVFALEVNPR